MDPVFTIYWQLQQSIYLSLLQAKKTHLDGNTCIPRKLCQSLLLPKGANNIIIS